MARTTRCGEFRLTGDPEEGTCRFARARDLLDLENHQGLSPHPHTGRLMKTPPTTRRPDPREIYAEHWEREARAGTDEHESHFRAALKAGY
jgi:hypothetical protein